MSFSSGIDGYTKKTKREISQAIAKINIDLVTSIIKSTPVDKGTARGNWFPSFEASSNETQEGRKEGMALSEATQMASNSAGKTFYLTNNLPYINRLEYGWSKQAPQGMVRIAIKNANTLLRQFKTTK